MSHPPTLLDAVALAVRAARAAGLPSAPVTAPDTEGVTNHVVVLGSGDDRVVARVPVDGADDFGRELWAMRAAARAGIPVPDVAACDVVEGVPVMLLRFVPHPPSVLPVHEQWRWLGETARRIADVPIPPDAPAGLFSRFGPDLPDAWRRHVAHNLDSIGPSDPLIRLGVYAPGQADVLRGLVDEAGRLPVRHGLRHGDLFPRNLRVDAAGRPVLIDWGGAHAGPVPYADLDHLLDLARLTGEPDSEGLAAWLSGWGDPVPARALALMTLLTALDLVRWAFDRAPERIERQVTLARLHVRRMFDGPTSPTGLFAPA